MNVVRERGAGMIMFTQDFGGMTSENTMQIMQAFDGMMWENTTADMNVNDGASIWWNGDHDSDILILGQVHKKPVQHHNIVTKKQAVDGTMEPEKPIQP